MKVLAFIVVLIQAVIGLPGIPDGNDKAYRFERDKHTYIHLSHVPNSYAIKTTGALIANIGVYSEHFSNCGESFDFTMQTTSASYKLKGPNGDKTTLTMTAMAQGGQQQINKVTVNNIIDSWIGLVNNKDYTLTVSTKPAPICDLWLHLGEGVTVTAETPYKPYVQPSDSSTYFVNSGILPIGFARGATGLSLDVMLAVVSTYTYYKGVGRPVPSIVVPSSVCTGVIHFEINNLCKISTEVTPNGYSFTVGANNVMIPTRPAKSYLIFTMTDVYLHMSGPLGIRKLGSCSFGGTFLNDAEFVMKTSYEKPESISCNSWLLTFVDGVALRRPPTTTTAILSTVTTDSATDETEETTTEAVSSAKTVGIVIGIVIGFLVLGAVVALIVGLITWFKKKKNKTVNRPVSPSSINE